MCKVLALSEGIPLAIEIIAAWVRFKSLDQIARELEATPLGLITTFDEDDSVSSNRHRSLSRCMEWSFQLLPKPEQGLFVKLGIFVGAFTEESVRSVCGVPEPMPLLVHLVKMSLLHPVTDMRPRRFSSLRFTRVFAKDKARTTVMTTRRWRTSWSTLKEERVYRTHFENRVQAASAIFDSLETFYNRARFRSASAVYDVWNLQDRST